MVHADISDQLIMMAEGDCNKYSKVIETHGCTNRSDLEMEPKYLTKSDVQLNPNILRTKNDKRVL